MSTSCRFPAWNALLFCLFACCFLLNAVSATTPVADLPKPVILAETESFELAGRFLPEGLVFWVDHADSNQPVLGASLRVEADGQGEEVVAIFRPEHGDYLIPSGPWLDKLQQPGAHSLMLVLQAGAESDLLAAQWEEQLAATGSQIGGAWSWRGGLILLGGLGLMLWFRQHLRGRRVAS